VSAIEILGIVAENTHDAAQTVDAAVLSNPSTYGFPRIALT